MRRFVLEGKYWEIEHRGSMVELKWGEYGSKPKTFTRQFANDADAEVFAERQIIAQRERGYIENEHVRAAVVSADVTVERHQRFEWQVRDNPKRFVEVTQEATKVSMRGGRIVDGRDVADRDKLHVENFSTVAAASASFDARCADTRYDGGVAIDPERLHAIHANADLEAQCEASRDAPEPWAVYADWLIAQGDVRGEIAALQLAGKHADAKRVLATHLRDLCGTDTGKLAFEFRHGFAVHCAIGLIDASDPIEPLEDVARAVLGSPLGRFVESLRFGVAGQGNDNDWGPTIHAVANSPRGAHVRALRFDDYTADDSEISWTPYGDFSGVWPRLQALEVLCLRSGAGGILGAIDLPNLRTLVRESGGLVKSEIDSIVAARCPKLEHLAIWFGREMYGAEGQLSSIQPILDGKLGALRHLGIVNCEFIDDVIPALARSRVLPQLTSLDFSNSVMHRSAAQALVAAAPAFQHLTSIDLDANFLGEDDLAQIRAVLPQIVPGTQRELDDEDDPEARYAAVGE